MKPLHTLAGCLVAAAFYVGPSSPVAQAVEIHPLVVAPVPESEVDFSPADPTFDPLGIDDVSVDEAVVVNAETDALINSVMTFEDFDGAV